MIRTKVSEVLKSYETVNRTKLAKLIGISRWLLTKLADLHEVERLELETIERLCRGLNIMPNDLFLITNSDGTPWKPDPKFKLPKEVFTNTARGKTKFDIEAEEFKFNKIIEAEAIKQGLPVKKVNKKEPLRPSE